MAKVRLLGQVLKNRAINGELYKKASDTHTTAMQEKASLALFEYVYEKRGGTVFPIEDFYYDSVNDINLDTGVSKDYPMWKVVEGDPKKTKANIEVWKKKEVNGKFFSPQTWMPGNNSIKKGGLYTSPSGIQKAESKTLGIIHHGEHSYSKAQEIIFNHFPEQHHKDDAWLVNFFKHQDKLFDETTLVDTKPMTGNAAKFNHYDRDTADGFMEVITDIVKQKPFSFSKKDTWNPADVWLVRNKKTLVTNLKALIKAGKGLDRETQLTYLNDWLREKLSSHEIVGVSLKKISGKAKWEVVNLTKDFNFIPSKGPNVFQYKMGSKKSKCDLGIAISDYLPSATDDLKDQSWKTELGRFAKSKSWRVALKAGYSYAKLSVKGLDINNEDDDRFKPASWKNMAGNMMITEDGIDWFLLPIKSNATSDNKAQNLKFEPVPENAPGSRAGKADVGDVRKLFITLAGAGVFTNQAKEYPDSLAKWNQPERAKYESWVDTIKGTFIDTGDVNGKAFVDNVTRLFTEVAVMAGEIKVKKGGKFKSVLALTKKQKDMLQSVKEKDDGPEIKQSADRLRYNIVSKLMQVDCLRVLNDLSNVKTGNTKISKLDVWVTYVCFMAQKKGKGFGPFAKLY